MKKHSLNSSLIKGLSLGLMFLFASVTVYAQHYNYESVPNDPMQTRIYTLKNGLKSISPSTKRSLVYRHTSQCALVLAMIQRRQQALHTT